MDLKCFCSLNWSIPWDRSAPLRLHSFGPAGSWFNPRRSISLSSLLNLLGLYVAEIELNTCFLSGRVHKRLPNSFLQLNVNIGVTKSNVNCGMGVQEWFQIVLYYVKLFSVPCSGICFYFILSS